MWLHGEAEDRIRRLNSSAASECLRDRHGLRSVGSAEQIADNLTHPSHKARRNCACPNCKQSRLQLQCENPHACYKRARELLDQLPEKWDPRKPKPDDNGGVALVRIDDAEDENTTYFDSNITTSGDLSDIFRIFTQGEVCNETYRRTEAPDIVDRITIATDGSCYNNGGSDARAGAGGFIGTDHNDNFALRLPAHIHQSNQTGEVVAASEASRRTDLNLLLEIISDSLYTIDGANKLRKNHEDRGYIGVENAPLLQALIGNLRRRHHRTIFQWVKGHQGHELNEGADNLAGLGAQKADVDEIDLSVERSLHISGAKLKIMTQKLAYQGIRDQEMSKYQPRRRTQDNMIRTVDNIEVFFGESPSEAQIWKGLRHKDIDKKIRNFLWMTMHDAYMVGTNWQKPSFPAEIQARQECATCGQIESMEHILSECQAPGQELIWSLAKELWTKKNKKWPRPSLGAVLSSPVAPFKTKKGKPKSGDARLYRILMTESAYLIWKVRCERVIQGAENPNAPQLTNQEIRARWVRTMNERLKIDCQLTNTQHYEKKALQKSLVQRTWEHTLRDESSLPPNWMTGKSEVLVGIQAVS
ncbi:hypothetical protein EVJ58_g10361 [Rhodofomes roseus]|uniref:ribonuclease H n=1 Tax=Rhodofomes roseus TaxID=34475 RepID=A0A4Y9XPY9_9APHY|nr:hypothetical protein EVJ58_g10361 [Rhodofomes roseus]